MERLIDYFESRGWRLYAPESGRIRILHVGPSTYQDMADFKKLEPTFNLAYHDGFYLTIAAE